VTIQRCLKEYNATRGVTMLLTSHYMRDVEALCPRVLVIAHGRVIYDGPLAGIVERFGRAKLVRLQFSTDAPAELARYGECTLSGPVAELKVERTEIAGVLAAILDRWTVLDMSVQDPPLDQVIARVFEESKPGEPAEDTPADPSPEALHVRG
jgi:ABC-2 type transport system ATP-binding protein